MCLVACAIFSGSCTVNALFFTRYFFRKCQKIIFARDLIFEDADEYDPQTIINLILVTCMFNFREDLIFAKQVFTHEIREN